MAKNTFTPWRYSPPNGVELPGSVSSQGPPPNFRDLLDKQRSGYGRIPGADYPDGYLGTIRTRREDRLLSGLRKLDKKSYTRGVHKGEKVDITDYFWPEDSNISNFSGIERQAKTGKRQTIEGVVPRKITAQGRFREAVPAEQRLPSVSQFKSFNHLKPPWS